MTPERFWAFVLAALIIELTPGPNMAYLAAVAMRDGRDRAWVTVAGITLGLATYLAAAIAGLTEAATRAPLIYHTLRWAGVTYLAWLAWDTWRNAPGAGQPPAGGGLGRFFLRGLLTNLLNPKAALLYVTLLPSFIDTDRAVIAQSLLLGGTHLAISLVVHGSIVVGAGSLHGAVAVSRPSVLLRLLFAGSLLAVAAWVALTP